jgi:hypothetical protein
MVPQAGAQRWATDVESFCSTRQHLFWPAADEQPIGELTLLRRNGSVNDYCNKFMALSSRDTSITEDQQVPLFTVGLGKPLQTDVAL